MSAAGALVADLQRPWRHGEHVDARGLVLAEPLVLDGLVLRGVDLSGARLEGGLSARGAEFLGLAWLRGAVVARRCDFTGARFRIDLRAEGLSADTIVLDGAEVRGVLALARIGAREVRIREALVMANLTLERAEVSGVADLSGTEVLGGFWAEGARIGRLVADGTEISGRVRQA